MQCAQLMHLSYSCLAADPNTLPGTVCFAFYARRHTGGVLHGTSTGGHTNTYQGLESAACGWHGLHCQVQTSAQTSSAAALQPQEQLPSVMLSLQTWQEWGHWGWSWLGPAAEPPNDNRLHE